MSIGTQKGPPIGVQKGPRRSGLCRLYIGGPDRVAIFCGGRPQQAAEESRHVALVGEAAVSGHDLERDVTARHLALRMLDASLHDIGMRRAAEFGAEFPQEMKDAELHHSGEILE